MERRNRAGPGGARIALLIQYDGTAFNGWQIQNGGRTVQGVIESALFTLTKQQARLTASGRTDSGVHALGQVAHFDSSGGIALERLCAGLNGIIERDAAVVNAYGVPDGFHARYDAVAREYTYLIYNHPRRSPFADRRAMWVQQPLDIERMRESASFLVGEHDFRSFCKRTSAGGGTVRNIEKIGIHKTGGLIVINIRGNAFLHHMVRSIAGTLVAMDRERRPPRDMAAILELGDRDAAGATAPACGLYLKRVEYDPPLSSMESAF